MPEMAYRIVVDGIFGREVLAYSHIEYRARRIAAALCENPVNGTVTIECVVTGEAIYTYLGV